MSYGDEPLTGDQIQNDPTLQEGSVGEIGTGLDDNVTGEGPMDTPTTTKNRKWLWIVVSIGVVAVIAVIVRSKLYGSASGSGTPASLSEGNVTINAAKGSRVEIVQPTNGQPIGSSVNPKVNATPQPSNPAPTVAQTPLVVSNKTGMTTVLPNASSSLRLRTLGHQGLANPVSLPGVSAGLVGLDQNVLKKYGSSASGVTNTGVIVSNSSASATQQEALAKSGAPVSYGSKITPGQATYVKNLFASGQTAKAESFLKAHGA